MPLEELCERASRDADPEARASVETSTADRVGAPGQHEPLIGQSLLKYYDFGDLALPAGASPAHEPTTEPIDLNDPALVPLEPGGASDGLAGQLVDAMAQVEQDLCYLEGAHHFVGEQVARTSNLRQCGVCARAIQDANLLEFAALQLQVRQLLMVKGSNAFAALGQLASALKRLGSGRTAAPSSPFRRAYMMRLGALGELRAQKQQALLEGECPGCSRGFDRPGDLETFLTMVDGRAADREEALHVHVNYCG